VLTQGRKSLAGSQCCVVPKRKESGHFFWGDEERGALLTFEGGHSLFARNESPFSLTLGISERRKGKNRWFAEKKTSCSWKKLLK